MRKHAWPLAWEWRSSGGSQRWIRGGGLAPKGWALPCFVSAGTLRTVAVSSLQRLPTSIPEGHGGIVHPGGVRGRFVPCSPRVFWCCASALPSPHAWVTGSREGETNVVSTPPNGGPLAMISIRPSSWVSTWWVSTWWVRVVTLTPCFLANSGCCSLERASSTAYDPCLGTSCTAVAIDGTGRNGWSGGAAICRGGKGRWCLGMVANALLACGSDWDSRSTRLDGSRPWTSSWWQLVWMAVAWCGGARAIQPGGSHPCVVNEVADAAAAWRAGTVGFKLLGEGGCYCGHLLLEDGDGICPGSPVGGLSLKCSWSEAQAAQAQWEVCNGKCNGLVIGDLTCVPIIRFAKQLHHVHITWTVEAHGSTTSHITKGCHKGREGKEALRSRLYSLDDATVLSRHRPSSLMHFPGHPYYKWRTMCWIRSIE